VLTGDKVETAINIGYSCRLLNNHMNIFIINEVAEKRIRTELRALLQQQFICRGARENAVVVGGDTLTVIFNADDDSDDEDAESEEWNVKRMFIKLCEGANVVLACRVSPKQKAEVVRMMRARRPNVSTLAIGDGANDVNMITAAHIGIGIKGLEGAQAARASDYAIGQFRFLKNLLLCHGRECYRRNSYAISYMFYKNIFLVFPIWVYGFVSYFSGTIIYDIFLYNFYNMVFTVLPIVWFSACDWQYSKQYLLDNPREYQIGLLDLYFNPSVFWRWIFYAVWQGILLITVLFYTINGTLTSDGLSNGDLYTNG
jgi:phospholipid-transporting ATPase